jgi:hypothetical protein
MRIDRLLDQLRIHIEAARDDEVLLAIDQIEPALRLHVADVAGQDAVADELFGPCLVPIPVAVLHIGPTDAQFADGQHALRIGHGPRYRSRDLTASAQSSPACPGRSTNVWCPARLSVIQSLRSRRPVLRSKIAATSTRSGAPPKLH